MPPNTLERSTLPSPVKSSRATCAASSSGASGSVKLRRTSPAGERSTAASYAPSRAGRSWRSKVS